MPAPKLLNAHQTTATGKTNRKGTRPAKSLQKCHQRTATSTPTATAAAAASSTRRCVAAARFRLFCFRRSKQPLAHVRFQHGEQLRVELILVLQSHECRHLSPLAIRGAVHAAGRARLARNAGDHCEVKTGGKNGS